MKCAKCGAEIRPGCVYCSNCGQEAQIVTEINILEDDLLRSMLDEESEKTKETVSAEDKCRKSSESSDTKQAERGRKQKKSRQQKKKQLRLLKMVGQRRGMLAYLQKKDLEGYRALIAKLGIRK